MLCRFCFSHRNFGCFDLVCLIVPSTFVIFPIGITVICNIICLWMGNLYAATPGQSPGVARIYIYIYSYNIDMIIDIVYQYTIYFGGWRVLPWKRSGALRALQKKSLFLVAVPGVHSCFNVNLVGGFKHLDYFSIYWEFHHPNWRNHIFQRGRLKPPTRNSLPFIVSLWPLLQIKVLLQMIFKKGYAARTSRVVHYLETTVDGLRKGLAFGNLTLNLT